MLIVVSSFSVGGPGDALSTVHRGGLPISATIIVAAGEENCALSNIRRKFFRLVRFLEGRVSF
jgi:hypothetical protein